MYEPPPESGVAVAPGTIKQIWKDMNVCVYEYLKIALSNFNCYAEDATEDTPEDTIVSSDEFEDADAD
jgi:hypothetical protein